MGPQCRILFSHLRPSFSNWREVCLCLSTVSAFVLCYTGDMPQQAVNCGFLAHNAHICCRICRCPKEKRGDFQYDIILNGRYHHVVQQRKEGQKILASGERDEFWRSHGLQPEPCYLQTLTPALDLVLSRAFDTPGKGLDVYCRIFRLRLFLRLVPSVNTPQPFGNFLLLVTGHEFRTLRPIEGHGHFLSLALQ